MATSPIRPATAPANSLNAGFEGNSPAWPHSTDPDRQLTINDVAEWLGVSKLGCMITSPERSHSCRAFASARLRDSGGRRSNGSFRSMQRAMDQPDPTTVQSILAAGRHMGRDRY
jgi:hypothetical protein